VIDHVAPLHEDEIETYMPHVASYLREIATQHGYSAAQLWDADRVRGELRFVPVAAQQTQPKAIIWRLDIVEQLGFELPLSVDDWERLLVAYAREHPDATAMAAVPRVSNPAFVQFFGAFGVMPWGWSIVDGRAVHGTTLPGFRDAVALLQRWYQRGLIAPVEITASDAKEPYSRFIRGKDIVVTEVSAFGGNWVVEQPFWSESILSLCRSANPSARFAVSAPPRSAAVETPVVRVEHPLGQLLIAFSENLSNDRARLHRTMELVDRITYDEELWLLAVYGIRNQDWVAVDVDGREYPLPTGPERYRPSTWAGWFPPTYWALAASPWLSQRFLHPTLRKAVQAVCGESAAPYSRRSTAWTYDQPRVPLERTQERNAVDAFTASCTRKVAKLFDPLLMVQGSVDAAWREYLDAWGTSEGTRATQIATAWLRER
jgi:hypothetical protein